MCGKVENLLGTFWQQFSQMTFETLRFAWREPETNKVEMLETGGHIWIFDTHRSGSFFRQWEYQQLWGGCWVSFTLAHQVISVIHLTHSWNNDTPPLQRLKHPKVPVLEKRGFKQKGRTLSAAHGQHCVNLQVGKVSSKSNPWSSTLSSSPSPSPPSSSASLSTSSSSPSTLSFSSTSLLSSALVKDLTSKFTLD